METHDFDVVAKFVRETLGDVEINIYSCIEQVADAIIESKFFTATDDLLDKLKEGSLLRAKYEVAKQNYSESQEDLLAALNSYRKFEQRIKHA